MAEKPRTLMYVQQITKNGMTLSEVGGCCGVQLSHTIPHDLFHMVEGRHCWIVGGWGDVCRFHSWAEIPKEPK